MTSMILLEIATWYRELGLSFLPIRTDGTKAPVSTLLPDRTWKPLQERLATPEEISNWFGLHAPECGIGIVCGEVSSGLEVVDIDHNGMVEPWQNRVNELMPGLLDKLVCVKTPKPGLHGYYQCDEIAGSQKLAQRFDKNDSRAKVLIETKGEGGYVIAPGSPDGCHPTGRVYEFLDGKTFANLQRITPKERTILFKSARELNEYRKPIPPKTSCLKQQSLLSFGRPGDDFNAKVDWADILEPFGWKHVSTSMDVLYWERPGKNSGSTSATTNFYGNDQLYIFTSNADPFEANRGYSKFSAFAILNHSGNYQQAARTLQKKGYGGRTDPPRAWKHLDRLY